MTSTTLLIATLLSAIHLNLHLCFNPQNRASTVANKRGAVKPPSLLRVELPISIGPLTGPDPSKSGLCCDLVSFHPKVPAESVKLPSDAMIRRCFARNARHTSPSSASCSKWKRSRRYQGGSFNGGTLPHNNEFPLQHCMMLNQQSQLTLLQSTLVLVLPFGLTWSLLPRLVLGQPRWRALHSSCEASVGRHPRLLLQLVPVCFGNLFLFIEPAPLVLCFFSFCSFSSSASWALPFCWLRCRCCRPGLRERLPLSDKSGFHLPH